MATRRRKLYEQMMGEILAGIVDGEYPEGSRLPKETDLAERHDVSRYVARECIQALRDRGVLAVKHGVGGATIQPRDAWYLFDSVLLEAMLAGPEHDDIAAEVAECRRIVWPEIAAAAARRHTEDDLARLDAAAGEAEFRAALLEAAGNRFLKHALTALEAAGGPPAAKRGREASVEPLRSSVSERDEQASRELMRRRLT